LLASRPNRGGEADAHAQYTQPFPLEVLRQLSGDPSQFAGIESIGCGRGRTGSGPMWDVRQSRLHR